MPEAENPYAPPAVPVAPTPAHGWTVQGDSLLVRDGTLLPEVDLDGRGAGGPVTPVVLMFGAPGQGGGRFGRGILFGLITALLVLSVRDFRPSPATIMIGAFVLVTLFLVMSAGRIATVSVKGYLSLVALRARQRKIRWRALVTWSGVLLFFAGAVLLPSASSPAGASRVFAGLALPISLLFVFGAAIWQLLDRRLACSRIQDGWLYLKGVGPAALAALAPRAGEALPPPRQRKVHLVYLHRAPLAVLLRPYPRNPWAWLYLGLLKLLRSKALEVRAFHDTEREWRPAALADADLRATWDRAVAGTPLAAWQPALASRMDGPNGNVRSEELVCVSPDRLHLARALVVRAATQKVFLEFGDFIFRSWTSDGRLVTTGNGPADAPSAPGADYRRVRGSPWRIARAHFARVAGEPLSVIEPEEVQSRMRAANELGYQAGFAAGVYGPVEEIELPGSC